MATAVLIASTVLSAYSAYHQGQVASAQSKYAARVADRNVVINQQESAAASAQQQRDMRLRLGAASAAYGASGVDPGTGTPLNVFSDSVGQGTLDNLTMKYNYKLRGLGYASGAAMDRTAAGEASTSGILGAVGSGLSGYAKYSTMNSGSGIPVMANMTANDQSTADQYAFSLNG